MLEDFEKGDEIILGGGYSFTWDNHIIHEGKIYSFSEIEGSVDEIVTIERKKDIIPKTLKFLKDSTGEDFKLSDSGRSIMLNHTYVYFLDSQEAWVKDGKISLSQEWTSEWTPMSPQEFVDKMSKGEYTWN